ncbi:hypothetical protein RIF29_43350 [Crotalaria pallida]|uniref:Uncharacterized protein n=1 Tax=Crotalaria pallida TaxID=3830 RepID=A0AAN9DYX1_CROPI
MFREWELLLNQRKKASKPRNSYLSQALEGRLSGDEAVGAFKTAKGGRRSPHTEEMEYIWKTKELVS